MRRRLLALLLPLALVLCAPGLAAAASLQEVQDFGNNPSRARMFIYVPDKLAASPPILVAIHYCGASANAYFTGTGYRALADQHGFIVIYPQTTSSDGCFDVHSDATLKHEGGSDSLAIVSMVRNVIAKNRADASRVYVTGTSSGAMMTNVLLGAYPDVFRGGAAFAGVPYGCFAGQGAWNSACSSGQTTKTGQQWGDLVRAGYPGYTGARPRVQLWHGDQDETLNFHNFGEAIKQWTNVLGVSEMPTTTEQNAPQSGWTRTRYSDAMGVVRVEAVLEAGVTHNLSVPAAEVVRFFGLNGTSDPGGPLAGGGTGGTGGADAGADDAGMRGGTSSPDAAVSGGTSMRVDAGNAMAPGVRDAGAAGDAVAPSGATGSDALAGGSGGTAQSDAGSSPTNDDGERDDDDDESSSCAVGVPGSRGGSGGLLALIALVALVFRSRKRSARGLRARARATLRSLARPRHKMR